MTRLFSLLSALFVLLLILLAVTRLRLPATQIEWIDVTWNAGEQTSRARQFDEVLIESIDFFYTRHGYGEALRAREQTTSYGHLWVDVCEVSQGDFYRFSKWNQDLTGRSYESISKEHRISGRLSAPANGVTFFAAAAYCTAAAGRLPFAEEWMAISSGSEGRLYPWGNEFQGAPWPYVNSRLNAAQSCGSHPKTASPEGVMDLANNVAEWSQGLFEDSEFRPLVHGGDASRWRSQLHSLNALYRAEPPQRRSPFIGFRCVYDAPPDRPPWRQQALPVVRLGGQALIGVPNQARVAALAATLPPEQLAEVVEIADNSQSKSNSRAFRISRCEVTRRHYRLFLIDPLVRLGLYDDEDTPVGHSYRPLNWARQLEQPELPVTGVDWWSARSFARWAGARLPTAAEWSAAVLGDQAQDYPWGRHYDPEAAVTADLSEARLMPCGAVAGDATPSGLLDMAGNAAEWTRSLSSGHGSYALILKGGSYLLPGKAASGASQGRPVPPQYRSPSVGIRLVLD